MIMALVVVAAVPVAGIIEQYSDISFIASRLLDNSPSADWNNRTIGRSVILEVFRRYW